MTFDCKIGFVLVFSLVLVALAVVEADLDTSEAKVDISKSEETQLKDPINDSEDDESKAENLTLDSEGKSDEDKEEKKKELEYNKGSLCGYCTYCKFCKLCDKECPCEISPSKPNCHMCKYCKYCYLCKLACETVCRPGGIVDIVSSTIYNQLPSFNKKEVDKDLDEVKDWIDKIKKEL